MTICSGFVHAAGVYLLSGYRGAADVGEFSVASNISSVNTNYISGFLTSFSPVRRTSLFAAAEQDARELRRNLINIFVVTSLLIFLAIALFADELIKVSPPEYAHAATVVPFALLGWTGLGSTC